MVWQLATHWTCQCISNNVQHSISYHKSTIEHGNEVAKYTWSVTEKRDWSWNPEKWKLFYVYKNRLALLWKIFETFFSSFNSISHLVLLILLNWTFIACLDISKLDVVSLSMVCISRSFIASIGLVWQRFQFGSQAGSAFLSWDNCFVKMGTIELRYNSFSVWNQLKISKHGRNARILWYFSLQQVYLVLSGKFMEYIFSDA